jgi:glycosyltransferase involved in cell wall biosynthesis
MQMRSPAASPLWLVWITENDIRTAFNMTPRLEVTGELRKRGWRVDLIACGPMGRHVIQGVEVICYPRPKIYLLSNMIFHLHVIRHILRNWGRVRVVMFSQLSAPWILPLRLLRILNRPYPVLVMDTRTVPMEPQDKATFKDRLRGKFLLLMNRTASVMADGQTSITERMVELLAIPRRQLWGVWSSGVNLDRFCIAAEKRNWPGNEDPVVVTYIGTLNYERNLMMLCRAITEANRVGMDFELWLYGKGNEKKDLLAFSEHSNGRVKVFDTVPNEQIPEILAGAHVGALPFPDEEKYRVSSPIKLFEYMGAGMPILATRIACHTDVIGDGEFVFWAEDSTMTGLLHALERIWQSRVSLPDMGAKALRASGNWTWSISAGHLDDALQHGLSLTGKEKLETGYEN